MVPRSPIMVSIFVIAIIVGAVLAIAPYGPGLSSQGFDWESDWALQKGFTIAVDAQGFEFPTSIAFVPNPATGPKDPLYFVTELQGRVKVVTNDRSVFTFVEDLFQLGPGQETSERAGLAAICLSGKHGHVFVTFVSPDSDNILRNRIVRLESEPETFSLTPTAQTTLVPLLESFRSTTEHQIGGCQVADEMLYVGVGDGSQTQQSQQLDSLLGKILRMTLDGEPDEQNPFFAVDDPTKVANYVWASGLRNPFGLKFSRGQLFVADNGPAVDRFLGVTEGENYLWDGSDFSIGANADAVLFPGKGVAQLDYYPQGADLFPARFRNSFFLTVTGSPSQKLQGVPAILAVPYDFAQSRVISVPQALMRYRGGGVQVVAGLGFGPDGLYFLPMLPDQGGTSPVLKLQYNPTVEFPYLLETEANPIVLLNTHGCFACHTLNNNDGGTVGPVLDRDFLVPTVATRLNSEEYIDSVKALDQLDQEPFASFRDARQAVQQAQGIEKVRLWLEYRIQEPRFDDPTAQMPDLGISQEQARIISNFLVGAEEELQPPEEGQGFFRGIVDGIRGWFPAASRANAKIYGAILVVVGFFAGAIVAAVSFWVVVKRRQRRRGV